MLHLLKSLAANAVTLLRVCAPAARGGDRAGNINFSVGAACFSPHLNERLSLTSDLANSVHHQITAAAAHTFAECVHTQCYRGEPGSGRRSQQILCVFAASLSSCAGESEMALCDSSFALRPEYHVGPNL